MKKQGEQFSFCATDGSSSSVWHIRPLLSTGFKYGGGVDTPALCGRQMSYDISVEITDSDLKDKTCKKCAMIYQQVKSPFIKGKSVTELNIGNIIIKSDGQTLSFQSVDQTTPPINLDCSAIDELMDFLRSCAIDSFNRRRSFRVPLTSKSRVSTTIHTSEQSYTVTLLNISLMGIFIEFPHNETRVFAVDSTTEVTLKFEGKAITLQGIVKRHDGNKYGIFFPEALQGEKVDPPPILLYIVTTLQMEWVAERTRAKVTPILPKKRK